MGKWYNEELSHENLTVLLDYFFRFCHCLWRRIMGALRSVCNLQGFLFFLFFCSTAEHNMFFYEKDLSALFLKYYNFHSTQFPTHCCPSIAELCYFWKLFPLTWSYLRRQTEICVPLRKPGPVRLIFFYRNVPICNI